TLKQFYMKSHKNKEPSAFIVMGCGAITALITQFAIYPIALIRTRIQGQPIAQIHDVKEDVRVRKIAIDIWRTEGILGFYRGLILNTLKIVPAVSISFAIYEYVRKGHSHHNNFVK
ncbi:unnamed protein product, partial [Didymodactylos carnosus]